jgi:hypothetical protein
LQIRIPNSVVAAIHLAFGVACIDNALSQATKPVSTYEIVRPPACANNLGETVHFVNRNAGRAGLASGMAIRDSEGKPVVFRSNYAVTPPEFQSFIDLHECAHHQTGDVDRAHPARNSPTHLMNESISDCIAILRLRDEAAYERPSINKVVDAMRQDMAKIGFPEMSIGSRTSNVKNCYAKFGSAHDIINGVLENRGLSQP